MLAVAGTVPLETLRDGILRYQRTRSTNLPKRVFEELCRAAGSHISNGVVSASERVDVGEVLGETKVTLVNVLRYRVKRNKLSSGVVSVPAGVCRMIDERKLELFMADGASIGTLWV